MPSDRPDTLPLTRRKETGVHLAKEERTLLERCLWLVVTGRAKELAAALDAVTRETPAVAGRIG